MTRVVFVSALEEGWQILRALLRVPQHREDIVAILTLDDRLRVRASGGREFDDLASECGLPLYKIRHINRPESVDLLRNLAPDLLLVFGWSQVLSDEVLSIPSKGAVGLHTTLLPQHRGRAPIPWSIIKGLKRSGNTLFFFDEGVDSGDIIGQKAFDITLKDDATSVCQKAVRTGQELVLEYLPALKAGTAPRIPQDHDQADYWPKRTPDDGIIDWSQPTMDIYNLIRGVTHPYPGAFTFLQEQKVHIWSAAVITHCDWPQTYTNDVPGDIRVIGRHMLVRAGDGYLEVTRLQPTDEDEVSASEYLRTHLKNSPQRFSCGTRQ